MGSRLNKIHIPLWFYIAWILYIGIRLLRSNNAYIPEYINSYLTDFLCLPIVLFFCLMGVRFLKNDANIKLNFFHIGIVLVEFILLFEIIVPRYATIYTADFFDAVVYFLGAICFYFLQSPGKNFSVLKSVFRAPHVAEAVAEAQQGKVES